MASVSRVSGFELDQPVESVFPLFSPEGEKLWAPGWDYESPMGSTAFCEDYVFLTRTHDHASAAAVWIVKKYEPDDHAVQYYKIEPGAKVGVITVRCRRLAAHRTRVEVGYVYTALSEEGNAFVEGFSERAYGDFIGEWKRLIEAYFRNREA
jgi:hypothetical protein